MTLVHSTKFDSQATQSLYRQTPDDETGRSLDGGCWYGLYRTGPNESGGFILIEDTFGFVTRLDFLTNQALELAWCEITTDETIDYAEGF